jgi:hypothetical protein
VKTTLIKLKNSPLKTCFYSHTIPPRVLKKKGTLTWFSRKDMLGQNGILLTLALFGCQFGPVFPAASAVESEKSLRWNPTLSPRYSMRVNVQSGFLAHWISGAHLVLGMGTPLSSAFALAWLFLGGIVGNSEILICSHALDLAGRK